MRDDAVNLNSHVAAAASDGHGHSELYQLMQMLIEADTISDQLNKHTVCCILMLNVGIIR